MGWCRGAAGACVALARELPPHGRVRLWPRRSLAARTHTLTARPPRLSQQQQAGPQAHPSAAPRASPLACRASTAPAAAPAAAPAPLPPSLAAALAPFAAAASARERASLLVQAGRRLPPLPEASRTNANRVIGCTAQVRACVRVPRAAACGRACMCVRVHACAWCRACAHMRHRQHRQQHTRARRCGSRCPWTLPQVRCRLGAAATASCPRAWWRCWRRACRASAPVRCWRWVGRGGVCCLDRNMCHGGCACGGFHRP